MIKGIGIIILVLFIWFSIYLGIDAHRQDSLIWASFWYMYTILNSIGLGFLYGSLE